MPTEQDKARAVLADEWEKRGRPELAESIRAGRDDEWSKASVAVSAMLAYANTAQGEGVREALGAPSHLDEAQFLGWCRSVRNDLEDYQDAQGLANAEQKLGWESVRRPERARSILTSFLIGRQVDHARLLLERVAAWEAAGKPRTGAPA